MIYFNVLFLFCFIFLLEKKKRHHSFHFLLPFRTDTILSPLHIVTFNNLLLKVLTVNFYFMISLVHLHEIYLLLLSRRISWPMIISYILKNLQKIDKFHLATFRSKIFPDIPYSDFQQSNIYHFRKRIVAYTYTF